MNHNLLAILSHHLYKVKVLAGHAASISLKFQKNCTILVHTLVQNYYDTTGAYHEI